MRQYGIANPSNRNEITIPARMSASEVFQPWKMSRANVPAASWSVDLSMDRDISPGLEGPPNRRGAASRIATADAEVRPRWRKLQRFFGQEGAGSRRGPGRRSGPPLPGAARTVYRAQHRALRPIRAHALTLVAEK